MQKQFAALFSSEVGPAVLVFAPRQLQVSVMPESVSSARGASQGVHAACGLEHSAHAELWGCPHLTCGHRGLALLAGWCSAAPNRRRLAGASQLAVLNTQSARDPGVPPSRVAAAARVLAVPGWSSAALIVVRYPRSAAGAPVAEVAQERCRLRTEQSLLLQSKLTRLEHSARAIQKVQINHLVRGSAARSGAARPRSGWCSVALLQ